MDTEFIDNAILTRQCHLLSWPFYQSLILWEDGSLNRKQLMMHDQHSPV